ncbi:hypothetical protein V8C34DRAFT_156905 [Trichoderma compactum]
MGDRHEAQVRSWGFGNVFTWSDAESYAMMTSSSLVFSLLLCPFGSAEASPADQWWLCARSLMRCCRNSHYPPHSHGGLTTHLIVDGEMTLWYPNEAGRKKTTYGVGSRVDVEAGRVHEVWIGSKGCTYVIGE